MKRISIIAVLIVAFGSAGLAATLQGDLTGTYQISGKTLIDPPKEEPMDTHFRLFLAGASAKDLYQAMAVPSEVDECFGDGSKTKHIGGTACTMLADGKTFECSLSVNIKTQSVESASAC